MYGVTTQQLQLLFLYLKPMNDLLCKESLLQNTPSVLETKASSHGFTCNQVTHRQVEKHINTSFSEHK